MSDPIAALLAAVACGVIAGSGPVVIRRLPEPDPEDAPADKVRYADLAARAGLAWKLAAVGAVAGAVVGGYLGPTAALGAWIVMTGVGVVLGYVDAQTRLLPTWIIAPTYVVLVAALVAAALVDGDTVDRLVQTALGWAVVGGFYLLMWFIQPRWLGYGDVRLSGLLGLSLGYLGWGEVFVGLYAGFLLGGVGGGVLALFKVVERRRYPFGPFMLLGALAGLLLGGPFADWYTGS